jgi:signal transduction histidine kinase/CheY-like chemotaxis protein
LPISGPTASPSAEASQEAFFLATGPAGRTERQVAMSVLVATLLCFAALTPFAHIRLPPVPAVIPASEAGLVLCDLLTAILLFGQFARLRTKPLLAIAAGYLFVTLLIVPHMLSFPGAFSATGLLGRESQTPAWLFSFWHAGFPLFVIAYATLEPSPIRARAFTAIALTVTAVVALVLAVVWLSTTGVGSLPVIIVKDGYARMRSNGASQGLLILSAAALAALLLRRRAAVLDVWLIVVMGAWIFDIALGTVASSFRYDVGWYGSRIFSVLAATFVLGALLLEMSRLYSSLTAAVAEARERNAELVRSRAELARAQRLEAVGELTGGVAHDFNNLLTAIVGGLDVIIRHPEEQARVLRMANIAMKASERGIHLVKQLLTFSRRQNLRPETVNPNALLREIESLVQTAAGDAVAARLELDDTLHAARIDVGEFQAAILNLISNARDAMPAGGRIVIETRNVAPDEAEMAGEWVMIAVSDTGVGMAPETLARAFEPFFTTKEVGLGTGLGLSQVYGFASSAGGQVKIQSAPGSGTTVRIHLPRDHTPASAPPPAEASADAATDGEIILVVEDDADVIATTAETLSGLGYGVLTAADAREALAIVGDAGRRVDILFSDVMMPGGMNGVQLAQEARRLRPGLKALLTSGFAGAALAGEGLPEDLPLLAKPYRQDELAHRLRQALR